MGRGEQGVGAFTKSRNEGDSGCLEAFTARVGVGGSVTTGGRNSHIQGEPFPPQGSQGTSAAEVSAALVLPTCEQRGCVRPSLPSPAGSSGAAGCEQEERSLQSPAVAHPSAPFLPFSSAGSDCPSALPCPGSAACNPPLPLGLSGHKEASPLSASEQSLCMAASAHLSTLGE